MIGKSPFDLSQNQSVNASRNLLPSSPSKNLPSTPKNRKGSDQFPVQMQYRLEKVFDQARERQEKYVNIIKSQEQKRNQEADHYLKTLREIKKQFMDFMQFKKGKKDRQWKMNYQRQHYNPKKKNQRLNSYEFTTKTAQELASKISQTQNTSKLEPFLHCKITFYYYTPHLKDYIRQILPEQLLLKMRSTHNGKQFEQELRILKDEDQTININYLAERIPFEIATPQKRAITIQFQIPCQQQAINFYKTRQFQLQLTNKKGMFTYAYSKLNLNSLLYYQPQPTQWKLKPLDFYSTLSGQKIGTLSLKLQNQLKQIDKQQHYKIQSNNPMQIDTYKSNISYTDDQSRMIHRISKFKTAHNSLLLGIGSSHQANAQRYFQNQNDKIVLMHKKKKELQSIQQYKNVHKQQLMDKLFNDAINQYYLIECQIGRPKFVLFNFFNPDKQHKKVYIKPTLQLLSKDTNPSVSLSSIQELISVDLVHPQHFQQLMQKQQIKISSEMHYGYDMDRQDNSIWTMSGMTHPLVVRVICYPPKQSHLTKDNLNHTYQLKLTVKDQYDKQLQLYTQKIKLTQPNPQHKLYFHGYSQTQTVFDLPFEQLQDNHIPKTMISNQHDLAYSWNATWTNISFMLKHNILGQKCFYIIINDNQNLQQISCYQVVLFTYPKLSHRVLLALGEVQKLKFDLSFDQKALEHVYGQSQGYGHKDKKSREQVRVGFYSSKPEHCFVRCYNQTQMYLQLNKVYEVEARIQTFDETLNPQRILIHCLDLDTDTILKRWLIEIQKEKTKYSQVNKISIQHNKPLKYRFQFCNTDIKQHSFRFYSSNLSILTIPVGMLSIISNQLVNLDLQFMVKQQLDEDELAAPVKVVLTATNGEQFMNYLFELNVQMK